MEQVTPSMEITTKQRTAGALIGGYLLAVLLDPLVTVMRLNVESWAAAEGYDQLYKLVTGTPPVWLVTIWEAVSGSWGLGFVIGAAIFAFWDPLLRLLGRRFGRGEKVPEAASAGNLEEVLRLIRMASAREDLRKAEGLLYGAYTEVLYIKYAKENFLHRRENWDGEACRIRLINAVREIEELLAIGDSNSKVLIKASSSNTPARIGEDQLTSDEDRRLYRRLFYVEDAANGRLAELSKLIAERKTKTELDIDQLGEQADEAVALVSKIRKSAAS